MKLKQIIRQYKLLDSPTEGKNIIIVTQTDTGLLKLFPT